MFEYLGWAIGSICGIVGFIVISCAIMSYVDKAVCYVWDEVDERRRG